MSCPVMSSSWYASPERPCFVAHLFRSLRASTIFWALKANSGPNSEVIMKVMSCGEVMSLSYRFMYTSAIVYGLTPGIFLQSPETHGKLAL